MKVLDINNRMDKTTKGHDAIKEKKHTSIIDDYIIN